MCFGVIPAALISLGKRCQYLMFSLVPCIWVRLALAKLLTVTKPCWRAGKKGELPLNSLRLFVGWV